MVKTGQFLKLNHSDNLEHTANGKNAGQAKPGRKNHTVKTTKEEQGHQFRQFWIIWQPEEQYDGYIHHRNQ